VKPLPQLTFDKLLELEQHLKVDELAKLSPQSCELLAVYLETLQKWTKKVDLVSVARDEQQIDRHIVDSVAAYWMIKKHLSIESLGSCIDVGSGAGLPGLIFAICDPSSKIYLCEPRERRVMFLKEVIQKLALKNVTVLGMRSEQIQLSDLEERKANLITARAVGNDQALVDLASRVLLASGSIAQLVGPSYKSLESCEPGRIESYSLPCDSSSRALAIWKFL